MGSYTGMLLDQLMRGVVFLNGQAVRGLGQPDRGHTVRRRVQVRRFPASTNAFVTDLRSRALSTSSGASSSSSIRSANSRKRGCS